MLKFAFTFVSVLMLTGCALFNQKHQTNQVMTAVTSSEQTLTETLSRLNDGFSAKISQQNGEIKALQEQLTRIEKNLSEINSSDQGPIANSTSPYPVIAGSEYVGAESTETTEITNNGSSADIGLVNNTRVVEQVETAVQSDTLILGAVEKVYIEAIQSYFIARVDTGAATSSINAVDMQKFERNGKKWVKFHVSDDETAMQDRQWIESRIVRHVKIRQANVSRLERRPVIELWVKIGTIHEKAQFTLTDRTQMDYPLLLGREFIQDVAIVDVSKDFIQSIAPKKSSKRQQLDNIAVE